MATSNAEFNVKNNGNFNVKNNGNFNVKNNSFGGSTALGIGTYVKQGWYRIFSQKRRAIKSK
ncbi:hypothetical protein [Glaciimonas soli]|uniref:hypothetical protein n=1 Tax=Glaciimonas soli TaxID=2590999 RepID=UPI001D17B088|nr:hypothetical protein [Glaciimonas soli]